MRTILLQALFLHRLAKAEVEHVVIDLNKKILAPSAPVLEEIRRTCVEVIHLGKQVFVN